MKIRIKLSYNPNSVFKLIQHVYILLNDHVGYFQNISKLSSYYAMYMWFLFVIIYLLLSHFGNYKT